MMSTLGIRPTIVLAFLLLLLSVADATFTDIGIKYFGVTEANPLMDYVYHQSIILFYAIKVALPCLLLLLIPYIFKNKKINVLFMGAIGLYFCIFLYHLGWLSLAYGII
ncbi:DUF5658 family protein [Bacillus alkalicellulosilyticus]|uniref:DUF5658 family protein n=1 Tax=Alkalihalobacterium alkalicellulosilyticum TaxID=1912214 RepID=UPI0009978D09|nr:DUF5658 family protein [Bacillus alkalicellulosilyticus]